MGMRRFYGTRRKKKQEKRGLSADEFFDMHYCMETAWKQKEEQAYCDAYEEHVKEQKEKEKKKKEK